ncbi:zinc ribbon domain-containing protein [Olsenella urininfantis]|uniref:zinc ribbon domain-containing protein n=1 Tax=Olsenella urininfantis TaxID=1871033 RepID=UPI000984635E|nr:C4-type zinc ribbon domain-containing protein [Olsenella urininfantis]
MNDYEALLKLQETDLKLMRLSRSLKDMPQQKKLAAIRQAQKKISSELSRILGQRKDSQMELEESEAQHAHLLEVRESVRAKADGAGYRELSDLDAQLSHIAKKLEKLEFTHDDKVLRLDRLLKAERGAEALGEKLRREAAEQEEGLRRQTADLMSQARTLAAARKGLIAELDDDTAERYERASRRFDGLAVERLVGNVPSVCRVKLQASSYAELRRQGPICECPYCHRLLVTEEVAQ